MKYWTKVALKDCARVVGGATPSSSVPEFWGGNVCWATPSDLSHLDGKLIYATSRAISSKGLASCAAELLPANSVLFSSRAPIGHVAINAIPMATNQGFKSLIPGPNLDASFLYWWLKVHRAQLERLGNGATFKEVSKAVVERIEILLPPLPEQKRIAAILDQADAVRRLRAKAKMRLEELCNAVFEQMFPDKAQANLVQRLGEHVSKIGSGATPIGGNAAYKPSGLPFVRSMNVRDGRFEPDGLAYIDNLQAAKLDGVTLQTNDVLINITGASVARVCLVPAEVTGGRVNQHVSIVRTKETLQPEYLQALLLSRKMKKHLLKIADTGATRQAITKAQLKQLKIDVPSFELQSKFVESKNAIDQVAAAYERALIDADQLFASLQHRAFRGELTARDASHEPAEASFDHAAE